MNILAGSKFPFVNMQNTSQMQQQQQQQQTQNNWPMHMGFNQNSNDGGFPHHPNNLPQQQQQHKSTGKRTAHECLQASHKIQLLQALATAFQIGSIQRSFHSVNIPNSIRNNNSSSSNKCKVNQTTTCTCLRLINKVMRLRKINCNQQLT